MDIEHTLNLVLLILLLMQGSIAWRRGLHYQRSLDFMVLKASAIHELQLTRLKLESIQADLVRHRSTQSPEWLKNGESLDWQIKDLKARITRIKSNLDECVRMHEPSEDNLHKLHGYAQTARRQQQFTADIQEVHSYFRSLSA